LQNDPSKFVEVATVGAAWLALVLSVLSFIISRKALLLSEQQEERRKPQLVPYLQDGYVRRDAEGRVYAFLLSVSNPTDSDNAVAAVDFQLIYTTKSNVRMTIKVPLHRETAKAFHDGTVLPLAIPLRLDAHQTVSGWAFFRVEDVLLGGAIVEEYTIVLTDSHGMKAQLEPILIREYGDATETTLR
jgi:hypothetical protein